MVGEWVETVDYPQAPKMTDEEVAALFDEALFARFATINRDRTVQRTPVFFKYLDDEIWIATQDRV